MEKTIFILLFLFSNLVLFEAGAFATDLPVSTNAQTKNEKPVYLKTKKLPKGFVVDKKTGKVVLKQNQMGTKGIKPVYQKMAQLPDSGSSNQNKPPVNQSEYKEISGPPPGVTPHQ